MSWTKEDQARVRELHTKCMTVKEIAKEMRKPQGWIRAALEDMGYKPIELRERAESEFLSGKPVEIPKRSRRRITPETEQQVCELREKCFTVTQIADKLQIGSPQTVVNILKRNGYPTERGKFHKEDKPMKAAQINEEFDKAVDEMIAEAKEKEPASVGADASSETKEVNSLQNNDTTDKPESQVPALTGIKMMLLLEQMLVDELGEDPTVTKIFADRGQCEVGFSYKDKEYALLFGEKEGIPDYGNDKH